MPIQNFGRKGRLKCPVRLSLLYHLCSTSQKIRFHERRGSLIRLSNNNRTAERRRPYDEFNNGVVMTHRSVDRQKGRREVGMTIWPMGNV